MEYIYIDNKYSDKSKLYFKFFILVKKYRD